MAFVNTERLTFAINAIGTKVKALLAVHKGLIDGINTKLGTIPADAESTTFAAYIKEVAEKAQSEATYDDTAVKADIKANADAITTLQGADTVDGSVLKAVKDGINDFATKATDDGTINTFKELIDYAASHTSEFSELSGEVQGNSTAIETITGEGTGSIKKAVGDLEEAVDGKLEAYVKSEDITFVSEAEITAMVEAAFAETAA